MITVVYENERFLAADKPAGWLTVPARAGQADPRPCLTQELRSSGLLVFPVHRLDVEVSGLVLLARDEQAHRVANSWFENRQVRKRYEALTEGLPPAPAAPASFEWHSRLLRGKKRAYESPAGKPAHTLAQWLGEEAGTQRWWLEPRTGRSHQLRFELARHEQPILGDFLYGAKRTYRPDAIALRSLRLDFDGCPEAASYGLPTQIEVEGLGHA